MVAAITGSRISIKNICFIRLFILFNWIFSKPVINDNSVLLIINNEFLINQAGSTRRRRLGIWVQMIVVVFSIYFFINKIIIWNLLFGVAVVMVSIFIYRIAILIKIFIIQIDISILINLNFGFRRLIDFFKLGLSIRVSTILLSVLIQTVFVLF